MTKFIEVTVVFDSEMVEISESRSAKMLIAVDAIQAVTQDYIPPDSHKWPKGTHIALVPSIPAYCESEAGETVAQDQRTLVVRESFEQVSAVLATERGIVRVG